ncbi:MAG: pyridoxal phosphate-dependent aminotransferase [Candidatus Bipolaricaulota bacterium]|nr:pyridoxal phosphate-dependent aminotransferase [Candidatus Bipolaricaulota bacterium]MBS3791858.1 pyridoxal phosphate-dependent aminotransferase [Candidatus Bipolaricaulota bacterium]
MTNPLKISSRALNFPESPIRKLNPLADRAKDEGVKVYHVNIGQPDIATPEEFMRGIREANIDVLEYSPSKGIRKVLESLTGYYNDQRIELSSDELMVTTGGSEAGLFAFYTTLEQGEEILIPEPFYTNYRGFAQMTGVEIRPIPTERANNFALPEQTEIENLVTEKTGALLLTNPSNPTGRVYTDREISTARRVVMENDLFLISDEVYREFAYGDSRPVSALNLEGMEDRAIMIDSISKRLSGCGARIGTLASRNEKIMNTALRLGQSRLSPPTMGQLGLTNFLNSSSYPEEIEAMIDRYEKRRNTLLKHLEGVEGLDFGKPDGAFYLMVSLPVEDAEDFVRWMLTDFRDNGETVMMAPGEGFYNTPGKGRDQVRLSYVLNRKNLERVADLIGKGLAQYEE